MTTNFQFSIFNFKAGVPPHIKSHFRFQSRSDRDSLCAGFTLVETLVSLVILTVAMIPIMNLSNETSKVSATIQNNLIASGLAQEGVEVIRAIRDTNWFNDRAFDLGLNDGNETSYRVEWDSVVLLPLSDNPVLNLDDGRYTYTGGIPTKFSRTITINKINAGELRAISTVTWIERGGINKSIGAELHLFNWK